MDDRKPFLILLIVAAAAIGLAVVLSRVDLARFKSADKGEMVTGQPTPAPSPTSDFESLDLSTTTNLDKKEVEPLYMDIENRVKNYQTVHLRTRLTVPDYVNGQAIESEIRFDAVRPDKGIHLVLASTPGDVRDPMATWKVQPYRGECVVGGRMRVIEYDEHGVYDMNLDSTEEVLANWNEKLKNDFEKKLANPLCDLFEDLGAMERFAEAIEASRVKTSEGAEIRVLIRMTGEMGKHLSKNKVYEYFPVCSDCFKAIALREDVFDAETGILKRVNYQDINQKTVLYQEYIEVQWDEPIPDDRFILPLPEHARIVDMTRLMAHKAKVALPREEAMKLIEEGSLDWPTLIQRNNDY